MLLYLFGLPAAGKNYVGRVLDEEFGFTFYDGDRDLTAEIRSALKAQQPFTDAMRDRYYAVLIERIGRLRCEHPFLAFGQATFKEKHRLQIAAAFPDITFVLVQADEEVRMARLSRGGNPVSVTYARRIAGFYEPPGHPHYVVTNNGGREEVVRQLADMLASLQASDQD